MTRFGLPRRLVGRRPDPADPAGGDGRTALCWPGWVAVAAGWAAAGVYGLAPPGLGMDLLYAVVAWGCVAAIVVGLGWHRPQHPRFWWLLAAGLAASGVGDLFALAGREPTGRAVFPGPAAWCQLAAYLLLIAAVVDVGRDRRRGVDLPGVLDAGIFVVGLGLLMWTFLVRPAVSSGSLSWSGRLVAAGFSVGGVLLLALLLRLLTTPGGRGTAYWLLVLASVLGTGSALAHQVFTLLPGLSAPVAGRGLVAVDVGLLLGFGLVAGAALHPSMRRLGVQSAPGAGRQQVTTAGRLGLLAAASLVAPALLAVQLCGGPPAGGWALVLGGAGMSLLVLARMAVLLAQVRAQAGQLAELADTDALTGVGNRRAWQRGLAVELARAARQDVPLSVAVLDLDHFKAYNDGHGHPAGDRALRLSARGWAARLRAGDLLARVGGEEFAVLLPACALPAAFGVAEDLRRATPPGLTVSVGVAGWDGAEDDADLLARADAALYRAKRGGRNRVVAAGRSAATSPGRPALQVVRGDHPAPAEPADGGTAGPGPAGRP